MFSIEFSKTSELCIRLRIRWANRSAFKYFIFNEIFTALYFRMKSKMWGSEEGKRENHEIFNGLFFFTGNIISIFSRHQTISGKKVLCVKEILNQPQCNMCSWVLLLKLDVVIVIASEKLSHLYQRSAYFRT